MTASSPSPAEGAATTTTTAVATNTNKVYLVTGANSGLGLETVRQLALRDDTKLVYMACRSEDKAKEAMEGLVENSGVSKEKLQYVPFDGSANQETLEQAASQVQEPLDGIILNAGGYGQCTDKSKELPVEPNQVLEIVQINFIGHVQYLDALEASSKLQKHCRIIYSGSEAARGVTFLALSPPSLPSAVDACLAYLDGRVYQVETFNLQEVYAMTKGMAALYFAAWAQRYSEEYHVLTVSPGGTKGTNINKQAAISTLEQYVLPILQITFGLLGWFHSVEVGAKRYVDAVTGADEYQQFKTGTFVATAGSGVSGPVGDQSIGFGSFGKQYVSFEKQTIMYEAMKKFRKEYC